MLQEFLEWEYEVAPDGTVLGTLMDANDHGIDAARYACSRISVSYTHLDVYQRQVQDTTARRLFQLCF